MILNVCLSSAETIFVVNQVHCWHMHHFKQAHKYHYCRCRVRWEQRVCRTEWKSEGNRKARKEELPVSWRVCRSLLRGLHDFYNCFLIPTTVLPLSHQKWLLQVSQNPLVYPLVNFHGWARRQLLSSLDCLLCRARLNSTCSTVALNIVILWAQIGVIKIFIWLNDGEK